MLNKAHLRVPPLPSPQYGANRVKGPATAHDDAHHTFGPTIDRQASTQARVAKAAQAFLSKLIDIRVSRYAVRKERPCLLFTDFIPAGRTDQLPVPNVTSEATSQRSQRVTCPRRQAQLFLFPANNRAAPS